VEPKEKNKKRPSQKDRPCVGGGGGGVGGGVLSGGGGGAEEELPKDHQGQGYFISKKKKKNRGEMKIFILSAKLSFHFSLEPAEEQSHNSNQNGPIHSTY